MSLLLVLYYQAYLFLSAFNLVCTRITFIAMYVFHKCAYLMTNAKSWVMTFEQIHKWFVVFMVQQD